MVIPIASIDDPRILPYRDLPRSRLPRHAGLFIAEGKLLVERLVASDFDIDSVLVDSQHESSVKHLTPNDVPIYVAPDNLIAKILGFKFHRGILACGRRRPLLELPDLSPGDAPHLTVVAAIDVHDPENLGGLLRNCAAFGVDLVLLSPHCADPFSRRVLRVSMGNALKLRIIEARDVQADLSRLQHGWQVELVAAVLDGSAEPLATAARTGRLGLVFGNEAHGLDPLVVQRCDRRLTIPMQLATDSLNVAVASGIFLYHFTRDRHLTK